MGVVGLAVQFRSFANAKSSIQGKRIDSRFEGFTDGSRNVEMVRGILLIVIDCLRADHVSAYGYPRKTTPTIDALAENGVLWESAHSTSSWTKPSVTSILTGLYPSEHGSFEGVKRRRNHEAVTTDRLGNIPQTLSEQFTGAGWRCGAFINNAQLGEFAGLNRGFDTYIPNAGKADNLIGLFEKWLENAPETPSFGYLHFLEAHWPYKPRRRHVAMFGGDRDTNEFSPYSAREFGELRREVTRKQRTLDDAQMTQMIQMYDGAVRRLDGKVKLLKAILEKLGVSDEFAIVVTADHGEEFLDHVSIGHGHTLYDELTHVPLIAQIPGGPSGVRVDGPVSHVDLAGTLLGMAGIENQGASRNLLSADQPPRPVFGELRMGRRYQQFARSARWKLHRTCKFEPTNGEIVRGESPRRLFASCAQNIELQLFDMLRDPMEQRNLANDAKYSGILKTHINDLDRWWSGIETPDGDVSLSGGDGSLSGEGAVAGEVEIDEKVIQRLYDLGYID